MMPGIQLTGRVQPTLQSLGRGNEAAIHQHPSTPGFISAPFPGLS